MELMGQYGKAFLDALLIWTCSLDWQSLITTDGVADIIPSWNSSAMSRECNG